MLNIGLLGFNFGLLGKLNLFEILFKVYFLFERSIQKSYHEAIITNGKYGSFENDYLTVVKDIRSEVGCE